MAATKTKRGRKPKQAHLPGMEPPKIDAIERLADRFVEDRLAFGQAREQMVKSRDLLEAKMKEHGLRLYEYDGNEVRYEETEKIVVRRKKESDEQE